KEHPGLVANGNFARDMMNVVVGTAWQTAQVALGIFVVLQDWRACAICGTIVAVSSVFLKYNWYDKIEDYPADLARAASAPAQAAAVRASAQDVSPVIS